MKPDRQVTCLRLTFVSSDYRVHGEFSAVSLCQKCFQTRMWLVHSTPKLGNIHVASFNRNRFKTSKLKICNTCNIVLTAFLPNDVSVARHSSWIPNCVPRNHSNDFKASLFRFLSRYHRGLSGIHTISSSTRAGGIQPNKENHL